MGLYSKYQIPLKDVAKIGKKRISEGTTIWMCTFLHNFLLYQVVTIAKYQIWNNYVEKCDINHQNSEYRSVQLYGDSSKFRIKESTIIWGLYNFSVIGGRTHCEHEYALRSPNTNWRSTISKYQWKICSYMGALRRLVKAILFHKRWYQWQTLSTKFATNPIKNVASI